MLSKQIREDRLIWRIAYAQLYTSNHLWTTCNTQHNVNTIWTAIAEHYLENSESIHTLYRHSFPHSNVVLETKLEVLLKMLQYRPEQENWTERRGRDKKRAYGWWTSQRVAAGHIPEGGHWLFKGELLVLFETGSHYVCSLGWPRTHWVHYNSLKLTTDLLPLHPRMTGVCHHTQLPLSTHRQLNQGMLKPCTQRADWVLASSKSN